MFAGEIVYITFQERKSTIKKLFAILAWIVFAALAVNVAEARQNVATNQIIGIVTRVSDGDTIWITNTVGRYKIRLVKIDAPESDQPYGKESAEFLKSLIFGKKVKVEWSAKDRYGRILGVVMLKRENKMIDVNLTMVKNGCAWYYSFNDCTPAYAAAEQAARQSRLGLWHDTAPVTPYLWRKSKGMPISARSGVTDHTCATPERKRGIMPDRRDVRKR